MSWPRASCWNYQRRWADDASRWMEFAFFENPEQTWRAIVPAVTNPLRGGVKKVRLITTPNGIGNKAHENLGEKLRRSGVSAERRKRRLSADSRYGKVVLPFRGHLHGSQGRLAHQHRGTQGRIDMGIDFGRRHDLTVCWSNAQLGDVAQTLEVLELSKMSTPVLLLVICMWCNISENGHEFPSAPGCLRSDCQP